MNIKNLFKKQYTFKKPLGESGIAKPQWAMFVFVFLLLLVVACWFAYYVFNYTTSQREGVYVTSENNSKKIDTNKANNVLNFFKDREERTNILKVTPTVFVDPSR